MKTDNLYTVMQFSKKSGLSRPTIYKYIKEGRIRTLIISGKLFVVSDKLLEAIEA